MDEKRIAAREEGQFLAVIPGEIVDEDDDHFLVEGPFGEDTLVAKDEGYKAITWDDVFAW